jgi:hypothetical protein
LLCCLWDLSSSEAIGTLAQSPFLMKPGVGAAKTLSKHRLTESRQKQLLGAATYWATWGSHTGCLVVQVALCRLVSGSQFPKALEGTARPFQLKAGATRSTTERRLYPKVYTAFRLGPNAGEGTCVCVCVCVAVWVVQVLSDAQSLKILYFSYCAYCYNHYIKQHMHMDRIHS